MTDAQLPQTHQDRYLTKAKTMPSSQSKDRCDTGNPQ
jgi:hypothetical protein